METAIWWIRRDIRLADNQALNAALTQASQVIPVFILDPRLTASKYVGKQRLTFLLAGLHKLDEALRQRGSYLVIRAGHPLPELSRLLEETRAEGIFSEPDHSPFAHQRDSLIEANLPIQWVGSPVLHPPGTVLKDTKEPYVVFTPFSRAWKSLPLPSIKAVLLSPEWLHTPPGIFSQHIEEKELLLESTPFKPGELEAQARLHLFTEGILGNYSNEEQDPGIYQYNTGRDRLDMEGSSGLSPYLRFGMISARQAVIAAISAIESATHSQARNGAETWLNELIWREFYFHILAHYPNVRQGNFRPMKIGWENNPGIFKAWCDGETGYPVVDAAMRQLSRTGWMQNRARMIVASFLTKDLLIDWRWGEQFFMQQLIDGDPAANNGGWQWVAGTGTDAAPYFRIFNPVIQSKKFDPQGTYIRRWLPELDYVPDQYIHAPWEMPEKVQISSGCSIGKDYPSPIVDHSWAKARTLVAYRQSV